MRILWLCSLPLQVQNDFFKGVDHGAQVDVSWIVAHFPPPEGIELHVACLYPGGHTHKDFTYHSVTFHLLPCVRKGRASTGFIFDHMFFSKLYKQLKPDIIHAWGTEDSYGLVAERLDKFNHVIGIQGLIRECYNNDGERSFRTHMTCLTERFTLRKAMHIVAENQVALGLALPLCNNLKLHMIIEQPVRRAFINAEPSDGLTKVILFVGAILRRKGIFDCLEAFAKSTDPDWILHIVGSGSLKSEEDLWKSINDLNIADRVQHDKHLSVHELISVMQASTVLLLPTYIDTGPNVLKEALAMGLWPVCYDNSGPGYYIRQFQFGSLAKNRDMADLSETLENCLSKKPWLDISKRSYCVENARQEFLPEKSWGKLHNLYSFIINKK